VSERAIGGQRTLLIINRSASARTVVLEPRGPRNSWRALFGDPGPRWRGNTLVSTLPAWGVRVLSTDPALSSRRRQEFGTDFESPPVPRRLFPLTGQMANAIRNPSFESEDKIDTLPTAWTIRDPTTANLDREVRHHGTGSLRLTGEMAGLRPVAIQRRIEVLAGHTYRLSGWMRSDTPGVKARFYSEWARDGAFHSQVLPWVEPDETWREEHLTFVASPDPEGGLYVVLQVDGPGRVWFDDMQLTRVD
jgi:hypothetical protein